MEKTKTTNNNKEKPNLFGRKLVIVSKTIISHKGSFLSTRHMNLRMFAAHGVNILDQPFRLRTYAKNSANQNKVFLLN